MLMQIISGDGSFGEKILNLLMIAVIVLISLTVHEVAHGFVAYKMGDPTARNLGRLTLDPRKHLDPIGAIMMLLVGVGFAKPVPVNSRYFKNPKAGMALTAAAGPAANFIMAFFASFFCALFYKLAYNAYVASGGVVFSVNLLLILYQFFYFFSFLNLSLGIFNLIPIPPFDGSRIAFIFLPTRWYFAIMKYERYILIGLLLFFWTVGRRLNIISGAAGFFFDLFNKLWALIPFLKVA